jgi:hypothetical protein
MSLTVPQWQQILHLLQEISGLPDHEQAAAILAKCSDPEVIRELMELIDQDRNEAEAASKGNRAGQTIGHYTVGRDLGHGGMGIVHEATDIHLDRTVAIKFLPEQVLRNEAATARFLREARASSMLNHPNIVTIHEFIREPNALAIVMERIQGEQQAGGQLSIAGPGDSLCEAAWARALSGARTRDCSPGYQARKHNDPE